MQATVAPVLPPVVVSPAERAGMSQYYDPLQAPINMPQNLSPSYDMQNNGSTAEQGNLFPAGWPMYPAAYENMFTWDGTSNGYSTAGNGQLEHNGLLYRGNNSSEEEHTPAAF